MPTEQDVIRRFGLEPLEVEGGMFRRTYLSQSALPAGIFGKRYPGAGSKRAGSAILYLLTRRCFSRLHRLPTDEVYHFYLGDPARMLLIPPEGGPRTVVLGQNVMAGMEVQFVVPAGWWQGARLVDGGAWALLGTTMAPAFDPEDYEDADAAGLSRLHPEWREEIQRLAAPADFGSLAPV